MTKKMLIDASHPEETRVVIVDGNRVEELDFESRHKRQIRGNVYLARVTRVEPSLQAAFIEYGGNRHGFLAFSEIHPDYYQIPHEDKLALLEAEEAENKAAQEEDEADDDETEDEADENLDPDADDAHDEDDEEVAQEQVKVASSRRRRQSRRRYKIQEVVKRGQILLIQAVKEERGNKGAAMTTYLSLAGRYCVLMPNTARGGGISRKIANGADRKRLKSVMSELEVPQGMGVIVRTAGAKRTKAEIKRDYEYLSRLWDEIRDTTLKSIAPALIHEEGNLVKRSIRDLYNKDIEEVLIQGEDAYKTAKAFMKMLMPSHAKNVKQYKDEIPLYLRYNVERQIEDSLKSIVQLKSGGYLVIHPTEALVSVDVNSGRSTKERNVERTALKTNSEAAIEVARQMRLRDLAGLIVIDFIDMDEHKNNRTVERKMKEALTRDRARVQTARISQFGLMEISRQRRRRSLLEGSTVHCNHCEGVGRKRTIESSALAAIRAVEDIGVRGQAKRIRLKVSADVALYIFNEKRELLQHVDDTSGLFTELVGDEELIRPNYEIEVIEAAEGDAPDPLAEIEAEFRKQRQKTQRSKEKARRKKKSDDDDDTEEDRSEKPDSDDEDKSKKRRRRRGRRGGRGKNREEQSEINEETSDISETLDEANEKAASTKDKLKRNSGRRKAPRKSKDVSEDTIETTESEATIDEAKDGKPKRARTTRKAPSRKKAQDDIQKDDDAEAKPKRGRRKAPAKKAVSTKEKPAPKKTTKRKTSAKNTPVNDADTVETKKTAKSSTRRKAPAKKAAPKKASTKKAPAKAATTKKGSTKKAAPKKVTKAATKKTTTDDKPKPASQRKTSARKAPAKKVTPKDETEVKKPKARRKAPAKKIEPTQEVPSVEVPVETMTSSARRKAPARKVESQTPIEAPGVKPKEKPKRRGWFGRRKKD